MILLTLVIITVVRQQFYFLSVLRAELGFRDHETLND